MRDEIFVFGSNVQGIHGAGAAKHARENYGARMGVGVGRTGNSYAIPTRTCEGDPKLRGSWGNLPQITVNVYVQDFIRYARDNPRLTFRLTAIGCGYAGFTPEQIAPLLCNAPNNVRMPPEFRSVLAGLPEERFWSYDEVA